MVLVRTETGQLVMVPQHVLAQAQAKMQQGQTVANIAQRPATPTTAAAIRVSTATTVSPPPPPHRRVMEGRMFSAGSKSRVPNCSDPVER